MKAARIVLLVSFLVCIGFLVGMGNLDFKKTEISDPIFIILVVCGCLSFVTAGISAAVYSGKLNRNMAFWGILAFLTPFITPLVLFFLPGARSQPSGRPRGNGLVWKCPKCGALLQKTKAGRDNWEMLRKMGTVPVGSVTCGSCRTAYPALDVYNGRYDV